MSTAKYMPDTWCAESGKDFEAYGSEGRIDTNGRLLCKCGRSVKLIERTPFGGSRTRWVGKESSHRIPRHRVGTLEEQADYHESEAERLDALDSDGTCEVAAAYHATRASEIRAAIAKATGSTT